VRVNPLGHCVNRATKKSKEFAPLHRCRGGLRKVIWTVSLASHSRLANATRSRTFLLPREEINRKAGQSILGRGLSL
jgi:hypothetical protein